MAWSAILRKRLPDSLPAQRVWPGWALMAPWLVVSVVVGYFVGHALGDRLTGVHRTPLALFVDARSVLPVVGPAFALAIGCPYFFYARGRLAAMEARRIKPCSSAHPRPSVSSE